jgi:hypothetical protein
MPRQTAAGVDGQQRPSILTVVLMSQVIPRRHGPSAYPERVRGDRVEIVIDAGGEVRTYEIVASRNGRRVEIETGRGIVTMSEVTRSGTPVRTARFMASRILALVEHPATDQNIAREVIEPQPIRSSG